MKNASRTYVAFAASAVLASAAIAADTNAAANANTARNNTTATQQNNASAKAGQAQRQQAGADGVATGAVLVLLPTVQASDERLGNGCWVRFYDGNNYKGSTLTLVGPVDMPKMDVPGPVWRDWDSAIVGPKATVTTYDNENFNDRTATLRAGQHLADLRDRKLGWFDEVKSARVACGA